MASNCSYTQNSKTEGSCTLRVCTGNIIITLLLSPHIALFCFIIVYHHLLSLSAIVTAHHVINPLPDCQHLCRISQYHYQRRSQRRSLGCEVSVSGRSWDVFLECLGLQKIWEGISLGLVLNRKPNVSISDYNVSFYKITCNARNSPKLIISYLYKTLHAIHSCSLLRYSCIYLSNSIFLSIGAT